MKYDIATVLLQFVDPSSQFWLKYVTTNIALHKELIFDYVCTLAANVSEWMQCLAVIQERASETQQTVHGSEC
jgi:alpha-D-ribose 1-methylphosphonate 5-triphosphate synthase subunit PhnH